MHSDALPFWTNVYNMSEVHPRQYPAIEKKSILDGSLYLGPFLKSDPVSGIQVMSPVTTCPAGGYKNGESAQDHHGWMELRTSGSEVT